MEIDKMSNERIERAIGVLIFEMISDESAKNFKGWISETADGSEYITTIQLKGGETPVSQRDEAIKLLGMVCGCYDPEEISHHFGIDQCSAYKITSLISGLNKND